jgi:hypothetical protein
LDNIALVKWFCTGQEALNCISLSETAGEIHVAAGLHDVTSSYTLASRLLINNWLCSNEEGKEIELMHFVLIIKNSDDLVRKVPYMLVCLWKWLLVVTHINFPRFFPIFPDFLE